VSYEKVNVGCILKIEKNQIERKDERERERRRI